MANEMEPGRVVGGRYRLIQQLGAGGFGQVWRARDETLQIDVAVKAVWIPPSATEEERRERLVRAEREARNAARLRDHPNVVTVHDVVVDDGVPWIVMQLVDGVSLQQRLAAQGPLNVGAAASVASALLGALGTAHAAGIQHRDVKPANVMLTGDGRILLTDFGIAVHHDDTALTGTGLLIGSVEYLAPERVRGGGGPGSDLFSLGVTLYQAVEGFSPFRRGTAADALSAVLFDEPPRPQRAGALAPLIARLLVKDPNRRATVQEAGALLETVTAGGSGCTLGPVASVAPVRPPAVAAPDARHRRRAIGALATAEQAARACDDEEGALWIARAAGVWAGIDAVRGSALADEAERAARAAEEPMERLVLLAETAGSLAALGGGRARTLLEEAESLLDQLDGQDRETALLFLARAFFAVDPGGENRFADEYEGLLRAEEDGADLAEELWMLADEWYDVAPDRAGELESEAADLSAAAAAPPRVPAPRTADRSTPGAEEVAAAHGAERTARALPPGRERALALLHAARLLAPLDAGLAEQLTADADAEGDVARVAFQWRRARLQQEVRSVRVGVAGACAATDPERAVALAEAATAGLAGVGTDEESDRLRCEVAAVLVDAAETQAASAAEDALALAARGVAMARQVGPDHAPYPALAAIGRALVNSAWWFVHHVEQAVIGGTDPDRVDQLLADTERALALLSEHVAGHPQLWVVEGIDGVMVKETRVRAEVAAAAIDVVVRLTARHPERGLRLLPRADRLVPDGDDHTALRTARSALAQNLMLASWRAGADGSELAEQLFEEALRHAVDLQHSLWLVRLTRIQSRTDPERAERVARAASHDGTRAEAWLAVARAWLRRTAA
ncbi:protein kinase [Kitasatospora sp. NPDC001540]|uniref:serine/threonine-protein kinase n=1 Tax=Kitasatospora sp. NPDC001540 TaxID=3364014 RepID=UPI0036A0CB12